MLKGQDIAFALKVCLLGDGEWNVKRVGDELSISYANAHASAARLEAAKLISLNRSSASRTRLLEVLIHGVKYFFVPDRGGLTRGIPTAYAAPPLSSIIVTEGDPVPVWPYDLGSVRGLSFEPLYSNAPKAAIRDARFYELLALVDALRGGQAREVNLAEAMLSERLRGAE